MIKWLVIEIKRVRPKALLSDVIDSLISFRKYIILDRIGFRITL